MSAEPKELYLAKSISQLNELADKGLDKVVSGKTTTARKIILSLRNIEKEADTSLKERDNERAYVMLYRFVSVINTLRTRADYDGEREYFNKLVGPKAVEANLIRLEKLNKVLKERYDRNYPMYSEAALLAKLEAAKVPPVNGVRKAYIPDISQSESSINNNTKSAEKTVEDTAHISVVALKNLVEQKATRFLVIDCRSFSSFNSSHLDHSNCVSIPDEILAKGLSASKVTEKLQGFKNLNERTIELWNRRETFDNIILYDWNSSLETRDRDAPISVLYEAMVTWDIGRTYKKKPQILQGGFREISYKYPHLLNNPYSQDDVQRFRSTPSQTKQYETKIGDLNLISYPVMDDEEEKFVKPLNQLSISETSKQLQNLPIQNGSLNNGSSNATDTFEVPLEGSKRQVVPDRSTKPVPKITKRTPGTMSNTILSDTAEVSMKKAPQNLEDDSEKLRQGTADDNLIEKTSIGTAGDIPSENTSKVTTNENLSEKTRKVIPEDRISEKTRKVSPVAPEEDISEKSRKGTIKRSQSIPNMKKMLSEDDLPSPREDHPPAFQRSLKPTQTRNSIEAYAARRRDFQAVRSTQCAVTGLKNLGNTCYLNSIIQCLLSTPQLVEYFWSGAYRHDINSRGKTNGHTTEEFAAVIREVNIGHRSISLNDFTTVTSTLIPNARYGEQQDSHEFLVHLLDCLHEELNKVKNKSPNKEQNNDKLTDQKAAYIATQNFRNANDSVMVDLFWGQQKSCVSCMECGKKSVTFEPFNVLSVPIPADVKRSSIRDCLDLYTSEERIPGFNCVACKRTVSAIKKIDLWTLPKYLIIHFQRFYNNGLWRKKVTEIDFPLDSLNLSKYALSSDSHTVFDLYGVSNHFGSMEGGHYTAYCRRATQWYEFDDSIVRALSRRQDIVTQNGYIVFYQSHDA